MFDYLQHLISLTALYLYPSYRSYKALDSKNVADAQEWLCYWIVAGILTIPLLVSNSILNWIPFYYEIKLAFTIWLILPKTKGHLVLFNKYVIPYMDKFSGKIDIYARDVTELSKKYADVAWKKGLEIAQVKFMEVLTKGPSALLDFSNISFNVNKEDSDSGRIKEIRDDEDFSDNDYSQKSNQMIVKKKRSNNNNTANVKKFSLGLNRRNGPTNKSSNSNNTVTKKRSTKKMNDDYNEIKDSSSYRRTGINKRNSSSYYDDDNDEERMNRSYRSHGGEDSTDKSLYMNMLSNHRPGPGGMMGINDVYSSESDDLHSNNSNSNEENYYEDEIIEENFNYNRNNIYCGRSSPRKGLTKVNQRTAMKDNYYDYDYDLTREDEDTLQGHEIYDESDSYSGSQRRRKMANDKKNYQQQQSFMSNFNTFFH